MITKRDFVLRGSCFCENYIFRSTRHSSYSVVVLRIVSLHPICLDTTYTFSIAFLAKNTQVNYFQLQVQAGESIAAQDLIFVINPN